jgi:SOS-response transcriptional repressor LexA
MNTQSDDIRTARKAAGYSQEDLAKKIGVSRVAVTHWENDPTIDIGSRHLLLLQDVLGINLSNRYKDNFAPKPSNTSEGPVVRGLVPLLSSVQAGKWREMPETEAADWLPCPVRHSSNTYALRVVGESMFNPTGKPSYGEGDIIFVDPDKTPAHGHRVVACLPDGQSTFKMLIEEDGQGRLKALNPEWRPRYIDVQPETRIVGVVIGKWVGE